MIQKGSWAFLFFMAKVGFNGQWIDIARVGKFTDSRGKQVELTAGLLAEIAANFNAGDNEAPLTIGHPQNAAPAFGWVSQLRFNDPVLEMLTEDTEDTFEDMVQQGRFRTRSAGIWLKHPSMTSPTIDHVAFLGAEAPGVKGLRRIQFSEEFTDGESLTVESIINLQEKKMEEKDLDQLPESFWTKFKAKLGVGEKTELSEGQAPAAAPVVFAEADVRTLITEAVDAVKAEFAEKVTNLEKANTELRAQVDGQLESGVRSEIAQFVESIPAENGKHYFKNIGLANFLESLAAADAKDEKKAVCFSEGTGDDKVDHEFSRLEFAKELISSLPAMVQFGEKFGNITATAEADEMITPGRANELLGKMGVEKTNGGEK